MKKRIFSILLVLVMIAGMLPVRALATETAQTAEICTVSEGCTFAAGHEGDCSPVADQAAAQSVIDLIDAIGKVTLDSESAISAADAAYNALTEEQKALVTNYGLLEEAKNAYMALSAPAPVADGLTLETGHAAEFIADLYLSKIVLQGVSGTVSGSEKDWSVELPEDTDTTQPITFELTSSVLAARKASAYFWVNDTRSEKTVADADPGTISILPEWSNGRATVVVGVGSASKLSGTPYTLELSIKGLAKEDFNTVKTGETGSRKYFVTKAALSGATATKSSVSDTDFSGSSSGHKATVEFELDQMPTAPVELTFTMAASGSVYFACNGGSREKADSTYTTSVDLSQGMAFKFITYSTNRSSTVRGTYTIKFTVAGMDTNTAPVLTDSGVTGEERSFTVGQVYTLDLASIFRDGELDPLTYTVQINDAEPVSAEEAYSLSLDKAGDYTLVFRASDGKKTSADCYTAKLKVTENTAPKLTGEATGSQTIDQYSVFTLDLSKLFTDAEGNTLTYTVSVNGGTAKTTAANYSYEANAEGTVTLVFQAKDHTLASPEYTLTLTVKYVPRKVIDTSCVGGETGDTWVKSITVTGVEVESHEWNVTSGHTESDTHTLEIQLAETTPDDAVIQLIYTPGYVNSGFRGSVSGDNSLTLEEGEGSVTVTTKGWLNNGTPRTYILKFTNKQNTAPTASAASSALSVNTGDVFTIDLSTVFTDADGDAMTYTVTADGKTSTADSNYSSRIATAGEYVYVFTAKDVWNAEATHTVTVTATQSAVTYDATVKVPEGITPSFYITGDSDGENGDTYGEALTATAGTAADGFVPYTVKVPENVTRISFRGVDAEDNNWGGMTAEVSQDMEPVTAIKLLGVIPSRVNNVYATAEQAVFQLKDKDGYYAVSGSTTTDNYGIVNYRFLAVAFGTDDLANAYTAYVIPQGELTANYVTTIGSNKTFTKDAPQQITQLGLTLKSAFAVTVPKDATVQVFQWLRYYKADEIPVSDTVENADGTVTWMFIKGDAYRMTYRASMEGKITKVGYVNGDEVTITWDESDASAGCRTPYDTSTLYGSRGDDSLVVNVNGQNNLRLENGGTFRLRGYRIWEVINSDTQNVMIQPDMHYSLTGDDIVTVTPVTSGNGNGKNNWLDLQATGSGVAYLELSYDAMQVVTGNQTGFGGEELAGFVFNACDTARTALVVVQVGNAATDVSFGIRCSSVLGNASVPWDTEFDTLYFVGSSGQLQLTPTVTSGSIAKVEVSGDKGASWTELTAVDGVYTAPIVSGNNIIRVTKGDGTEAYQVVRGDKLTYTMTEKNGDGDNVPEPGETYRVQLNGVHNPVGKMSGNYNPGWGGGQQIYYKFNGSTVRTAGSYQYDFVSNAYVDITIPADAKTGDTFTLSNGYIGFVVTGIADFTNDTANHRGIGDDGCNTRGSGGTSHQRSILPEITLTVRDSDAEIKAVMDMIDAIGEVTLDSEQAITAVRNAYDALSDGQKESVTNYADLQKAEEKLAQLQSDAADAAAAANAEALINAIGEVTLDSEQAVTAARDTYDALTDLQKKLVAPAKVTALEEAEKALAALKDQQAASQVDEKIAAIGEVTLDDEQAISDARAAYSALTADQKKLVTKLSVLEEAEKELSVLKNTGGVDYGLSADEIIGYVTVSFEDYGERVEGESIDPAYAKPRGVIVEATKVPFKPYDTIATVTLRLLKAKGITASYTGSEFSGFYLSAIDGFGEFSAGSGSGWMVTQNGWFINKGASEFNVQDGDVIKWQYTCQLGKDVGNDSYYKSVEDVIDLIDGIGTVTLKSEDKIKKARQAYDKLSENDKKRVSNYDKLTEAEEKLAALQKAEDEKKANAVEDLIDEIIIGSETFEEDVAAAKDAYDALTSAQKKLVENYADLADALKELASQEDKEAAEEVEMLINGIGTVTADSEETITAARQAYNALTDTQKELVGNLATLEAAEEALAQLLTQGGAEDIYKTTGDYLEYLGIPIPGSVGGEWMVIGLARSGREVPDEYYDNVVAFVQENIDENQRLHSAKSTENSRVILALTALSKDVTNVDGHNLLMGLTDMAYVQKQGINGPIWALMAFDSGNYPIPEGGDVTRQALIQVILDAQLADGGWALSGSVSDPDMTGMALQALAPYHESNADVKAAVDEAVAALSNMQAEDGSFKSIDGKNSESIAQAIVALTALGIDPDTDARFVKNGVSLIDVLCGYYVAGGGFRHTPEGKLDGMATEQGYYALAAYYRMKDGKTGLYNMTDVVDMGGDVTASDTPVTSPAPIEEKDGFPWWILLVVLAAGIVIAVVVIVAKRKKQ